jgi:hypothetical protein
MRAADAIDLDFMGGTHDGEQDFVSRGGIGGQVVLQQEGAAGGAAAHDDAGDFGLHVVLQAAIAAALKKQAPL